jgi:hypothetical protein
MRFGVYHYPWYCEQRWREFPRHETPALGEYDSTDPAVVATQMQQIADVGFDYVAFEIVPPDDWCFRTMMRSIELSLPRLRALGLRWTFLIDANTDPALGMGFERHRATLQELESRGWTEGMVPGADGKPLLLFFAPVPDVARVIRRHRGARYDCRFPAWFPHWGDPADTASWADLFRPFVDEARARGGTLAEVLAPQGYTVFWEDALEVQRLGGHCAVTRGYDDTLLRRNPQLSPVLPDRDGATLEAQMTSAVRQRPEHVLVYGWNEYFEHSTIEPTMERGAHFADQTRRAIAAARKWG